MHIEELKQKVESCRAALTGNTGQLATTTESGPLDISIIDAMVAAIESQDLRITVLESRFGVVAPQGTFPSGLESAAVHDQAVKLQRVKNTAAAKARATLEE